MITEPVPEPILPPVVDGGSSSDSGTGESADSGDGQGAESAEAGEADAGSGADGGADVAVAFYRDDLYRAEDEESGRATGDAEASGDASEAEVVVVEDRDIVSSSVAVAMEIARDMEFLRQTIQQDRTVLEGVLAHLREEYHLRGATEWGGLRAVLGGYFETGNAELQGINRTIAEMNRQLEVFRRFPEERRDGMILESLRELIDSASRRSGESDVISRALAAVLEHLRECRQQGLPVPGGAELSSVFDSAREQAQAVWLARAARNDTMGRDLAVAEKK